MTLPDLNELLNNVPHLEDYFGLWAMEEGRFQSAVDHVRSIDLAAHLRANAGMPQAANGNRDYPVSDGLATIQLTGTLMKRVGSLTAGTSTIRARQQIRAAAADDNVSAILLVIDSPGGTGAGTSDLAAAVLKAREAKPVYAFIEDLGASAAYWVASQAEKVYANKTALIGSIGVFTVIEDFSGYAAREGIKVHVLRAGEFKGAGTPGTEVTPTQLAQWQSLVDALFEHFVEAVASGRRMNAQVVKTLADGRVHDAAKAEGLGLIDGVRSMDTVFGDLRKVVKTRRLKMTDKVEQQTQAPSPATYQDIVGVCKGANSEFICECLKKGLTMDACREAWMTELNERVSKAEEAAQEAEKKATAAAAPKAGVDPLPGAGSAEENADPISAFDALVREQIASGKERPAAVVAAGRTHPGAYRAYLLAINPSKKAQRMVDEKLES